MRWIIVFSVMALSACQRDRPPAPTTTQAGELDEAETLLNQMDDEKGRHRLAPPLQPITISTKLSNSLGNSRPERA